MHESVFYPGIEPQTYTASCHCKTIRYHVTIPSLATAEATRCNCSFCSSTGLLVIMAWRDDITIESGASQLKTYEFGKKQIVHKFCPTCSTNLFVDHLRQTDVPGLGDISGYVGANVRPQNLLESTADVLRFERSTISILMKSRQDSSMAKACRRSTGG